MNRYSYKGGKMKIKKQNKQNLKIRYNIITTGVYFVGIILFLQLFNLQIIHGTEYRETSNTRLSRESTLKAARGNICDNTGAVIVGTTTSNRIELYKSKIENDILNKTLLDITNVLESNKDTYIDELPIAINPFRFTYQNQEKEENIGAVGDQIFTDVIGANRCHLFPILVEPIGEKDILITKIKRPLEQYIIKKYQQRIAKKAEEKGK